jgi:hypothetical protein
MTTPPSTLDTNASQLSYGVETVWGTAPSTTFNAIRYTSENLSMTKTRNRPTEINANREATQAVTTALQAGGTIGYALSYQTYDDFLASAINTTWSALVTVAGVAADIVLTNVSPTQCTITTATAGKFTNITQGNWIRTLGFVSNAGQNNQIMYVLTKASATSLTLTTTSATVTETPTGTLAQIRQRNIRNSTSFTSFYLQQKYAAALWLRYAGAYVSGMTITGGVGQYLSGTITLLAQSEASSTTTADTGGITAAPGGTVMNPVGGFGGVFFNETSVGIVDSFTINIASPGAALEYGMGSASAQGLLQGNLEVTGSMKIYFQNFTLYSNFINETQGRVSIIAKDAAGQAYVIQLLNAFLSNPKIDAGGPNQPVYATFDLEGNPTAATGVNTISIDELPAT